MDPGDSSTSPTEIRFDQPKATWKEKKWIIDAVRLEKHKIHMHYTFLAALVYYGFNIRKMTALFL